MFRTSMLLKPLNPFGYIPTLNSTVFPLLSGMLQVYMPCCEAGIDSEASTVSTPGEGLERDQELWCVVGERVVSSAAVSVPIPY